MQCANLHHLHIPFDLALPSLLLLHSEISNFEFCILNFEFPSSSPMSSAPPWQETPQGLRLHLRVQPRSPHDRIVGLLGNALKICVTAAPVEGAANEAVVRLLARSLAVPRSAIRIVRGHTGREKTVEIVDAVPRDLAARLQALVAPNVDKDGGCD
jgi:uncharacterized protein (TIGR00251 family)